ncbi:GOGB1 protein, partial [Atractosteus spatula]|nr:GOGB1 protein [Atractosteus spatula]
MASEGPGVGEDVLDRLAQTEQLVVQLKEVIRERDAKLQSAERQLKSLLKLSMTISTRDLVIDKNLKGDKCCDTIKNAEEREAADAKLSKLKLQAKAKVVTLNKQIEELKGQARPSAEGSQSPDVSLSLAPGLEEELQQLRLRFQEEESVSRTLREQLEVSEQRLREKEESHAEQLRVLQAVVCEKDARFQEQVQKHEEELLRAAAQSQVQAQADSELQQALRSAQRRTEELEESLRSRSQVLEMLQQEILSADQQKQILTAQFRQMEAELEEAGRQREEQQQRWADKAAKAEAQLAELIGRLEAAEGERAETAKREEEEAAEISFLRERLEAAERERDEAVRRERDEAARREAELVSLSEKLEAAEGERDEAVRRERDEAARREAELVSLSEKLEAAEGERDEAVRRERDEAARREAELVSLSEKLEAAEGERDEAVKRERDEAARREAELTDLRERLEMAERAREAALERKDGLPPEEREEEKGEGASLPSDPGLCLSALQGALRAVETKLGSLSEEKRESEARCSELAQSLEALQASFSRALCRCSPRDCIFQAALAYVEQHEEATATDVYADQSYTLVSGQLHESIAEGEESAARIQQLEEQINTWQVSRGRDCPGECQFKYEFKISILSGIYLSLSAECCTSSSKQLSTPFKILWLSHVHLSLPFMHCSFLKPREDTGSPPTPRTCHPVSPCFLTPTPSLWNNPSNLPTSHPPPPPDSGLQACCYFRVYKPVAATVLVLMHAAGLQVSRGSCPGELAQPTSLTHLLCHDSRAPAEPVPLLRASPSCSRVEPRDLEAGLEGESQRDLGAEFTLNSGALVWKNDLHHHKAFSNLLSSSESWWPGDWEGLYHIGILVLEEHANKKRLELSMQTEPQTCSCPVPVSQTMGISFFQGPVKSVTEQRPDLRQGDQIAAATAHCQFSHLFSYLIRAEREGGGSEDWRSELSGREEAVLSSVNVVCGLGKLYTCPALQWLFIIFFSSFSFSFSALKGDTTQGEEGTKPVQHVTGLSLESTNLCAGLARIQNSGQQRTGQRMGTQVRKSVYAQYGKSGERERGASLAEENGMAVLPEPGMDRPEEEGSVLPAAAEIPSWLPESTAVSGSSQVSEELVGAVSVVMQRETGLQEGSEEHTLAGQNRSETHFTSWEGGSFEQSSSTDSAVQKRRVQVWGQQGALLHSTDSAPCLDSLTQETGHLAELEGRCEELQAVLQQRDMELQNLREAVSESQRKTQEAEGALQALLDIKKQAEAQMQQQREGLEAARAELSQMARLRSSELESRSLECGMQEEQLRSLETESRSKDQKIQALQADMDRVQHCLAEQEGLARALRTKLEEREEALARLQELSEAASAAETALAQKAAEIGDLKQLLVQKEQEMRELNDGMSSKLVQAGEERFALTSQVAKLKGQLSELEKALEERERESDALRAQIETMKGEGEQVKRKLQAALVHRKELMKKMEEMKRDVERREGEARENDERSRAKELEKEAEVQNLIREREMHRERDREREEEMSKLEAALEEARQHLIARDAQLETLKGRIAEQDRAQAGTPLDSEKQNAESQTDAAVPSGIPLSQSGSPAGGDEEEKAELRCRLASLEAERESLQRKLQEALASRKDTIRKAKEKDRHHREQLKQQKDDYNGLLERCEEQGREREGLLQRLGELEELQAARRGPSGGEEQAERAELRQKLQAGEAETERGRAERKKLIEEVDRALLENQSLGASCESLKLAMEGILQEKDAAQKEASLARETAAQETRDWADKVRGLQEEYETLLRSYENVSDEAERVRRVLEAARQERQELAAKARAQEAARREAEERAEEARREVEAMKEKMRKFAKSKQQKILELEEENEKLREREEGKEGSRAHVELERAREELKAVAADLEAARAERDSIEQEANELRQRLEEEQARGKAEEERRLEAERQRLGTALRQAEQRLEEALKERERQAAAAQEARQAAEGREGQVQQLQSRLDESLARLAAFSRAMSSLQDDRDRVLDEAKQWESRFHSALQAKEAEVRQGEAQVRELEERLQGEAAQKEELQGAVDRSATIHGSVTRVDRSAIDHGSCTVHRSGTVHGSVTRVERSGTVHGSVTRVERSATSMHGSVTRVDRSAIDHGSCTVHRSGTVHGSVTRVERSATSMHGSVTRVDRSAIDHGSGTVHRLQRSEAEWQRRLGEAERRHQEAEASLQGESAELRASLAGAEADLARAEADLASRSAEEQAQRQRAPRALEAEREAQERRDESRRLEERARKAEEESSISKAQLESFTKAMTSLQDDRDRVLSQYKQLEERHLQVMMEKDALIQEAAGENNSLKGELRSLLAQRDDLNAEKAKLSAELHGYRDDLTQVLSMKESQHRQLLSAQLERVGALEREREQGQARVRELESRIQELERERAEAEGRIRELERERAEAEGRIREREREERQGEVREVERSAGGETARGPAASERERESEAEELREELRRAQERIASLERELRWDAGVTRTQAETAEERVAELSRDLLETEQRLLSAREEAAELRVQSEAFGRSMASLQDARDEALSRAQALQRRLEELEQGAGSPSPPAGRQGEVQGLRNALAALQSDRERLLEELQLQKAQCTKLEKEAQARERAETAEQQARERAETAEQQAREKTEAAEQLAREKETGLQELETLRQERTGWQSQAELLKQQFLAALSDKEQQIRDLNALLQDVRSSGPTHVRPKVTEEQYQREASPGADLSSEALASELRALQTESGQLKGHLNESLKELHLKELKIQQLNNKVFEEKRSVSAQLRGSAQRLNEAQSRCGALQRQLQELQDEKSKGSPEIDSAPGAPQERNLVDSKGSGMDIKELLHRLEEERERRQALEEELGAAEERLKRSTVSEWMSRQDVEPLEHAVLIEPPEGAVTKMRSGGPGLCRTLRSLFCSRQRTPLLATLYLLMVHVLLLLCMGGYL